MATTNKKKATPKSKKTGKAAPKYRKLVILLWLIILSPFLGLGALLLIARTSDKMPKTEELANPKTNLATEILTTDKQVIGRYYSENRSDVKYANIPKHLVHALTSTEDARYYGHSGVDFYGLGRAVAFMGKRGGGSTITQQFAKLLFTEMNVRPGFLERALLQKPKEWIIATRLEKQYTKEEIITLYLNKYDFINQAVGIKSAAQVYFNKQVDSLNVQESALLVGMLKNASLFNPLRESRKQLVIDRRNTVLNQMEKYGHLTEGACDSLKQLPLGLDFQKVSHDEGSAPYFREYLRAETKKILSAKDGDKLRYAKKDGSEYNIYKDGLKIYTTLDSRMQEHAEWAVNEHMSTMLQKEFWGDLKKRNKASYPFYNGIQKKDKDAILGRAKKNSERYKMDVGALCPDCRRPKAYITTIKKDGKEYFNCSSEKSGCGHEWHKMTPAEVEKDFSTPTKMKVFSYQGERDTTMSPMDSIIYHKTFLHTGMMSVDPNTGHIKAWVGGVDFKHFQYDNVYLSRRQVGSTFKPFVYATAVRFGEQPCKEYPNQKTCIDLPGDQGQWCPDNSDMRYGEMVSLEYALANSVNTITALMIKKYRPEPVIELAKKLGIKSPIEAVPSIALGVAQISLFEMVGANAALVNKGVYIEPTAIVRIEDKNGNIVYEAELNTQEALDERTAAITLNMMKKVTTGAYNRERNRTSGTGVRLRMDIESRKYDNIKYPTAGKTGTTQNNTDGWFMGLTPDLVTGVWVGAADPTIRFSSTALGQGANTALPIYGYYMNKIYKDKRLDVSTEDFDFRGSNIGAAFDCSTYYQNQEGLDFGSGDDDEGGSLFD